MDSRPDDRLLTHYNLELQYLKELGAEFAQEFPKIASRLGMNGIEIADPYVERLLEGVAFLAARVQLKLDAEFPRLTQALLEIVHPHFLRPTPPMVVAQLRANPNEKDLARGVTVPRGSTMLSVLAADEVTECEFRTAHDVTLWPLEIAAASYFTFAPDLGLNALPVGPRIRAGLRIKLRATGGLIVQQLALDRLTFFITGREAHKIYVLCQAAALGVVVLPNPA